MSGECDFCGEHCLDCTCTTKKGNMMDEYNIEELAITFRKHEVEADKMDAENREKYPDIYAKNGPFFNVSRALAVICEEICKLKSV